MHHIIYGIIVGVAVAAIIIVQLGDLFKPGNAPRRSNQAHRNTIMTTSKSWADRRPV